MSIRYRAHPLHLAACKGRLNLVRRILDEGYNAAATHDEDGTVLESMARLSDEVGPSSSSRDIICALKSPGVKYDRVPVGTLREMLVRLHVLRDEDSVQEWNENGYY